MALSLSEDPRAAAVIATVASLVGAKATDPAAVALSVDRALHAFINESRCVRHRCIGWTQGR